MTSQITIYLSQFLGRKFASPDGQQSGIIKDVLIDVNPVKDEPFRPRVIALKVWYNNADRVYDLNSFTLTCALGRMRIKCLDLDEISTYYMLNVMWLRESILYRKIVDINGKELVRVSDVRLVKIPSGIYALAVEAGWSGYFRRLGILDVVERLLKTLHIDYPIHGKLILWDDIHALKNTPSPLQLTAAKTRLKTLHP
ncbi:MAG: hypothetical protein Q8867_09740, partial [Bacteroidota bacterium]|nr:hypothetical protein [Bacteroidota bacterium]